MSKKDNYSLSPGDNGETKQGWAHGFSLGAGKSKAAPPPMIVMPTTHRKQWKPMTLEALVPSTSAMAPAQPTFSTAAKRAIEDGCCKVCSCTPCKCKPACDKKKKKRHHKKKQDTDCDEDSGSSSSSSDSEEEECSDEEQSCSDESGSDCDASSSDSDASSSSCSDSDSDNACGKNKRKCGKCFQCPCVCQKLQPKPDQPCKEKRCSKCGCIESQCECAKPVKPCKPCKPECTDSDDESACCSKCGCKRSKCKCGSGKRLSCNKCGSSNCHCGRKHDPSLYAFRSWEKAWNFFGVPLLVIIVLLGLGAWMGTLRPIGGYAVDHPTGRSVIKADRLIDRVVGVAGISLSQPDVATVVADDIQVSYSPQDVTPMYERGFGTGDDASGALSVWCTASDLEDAEDVAEIATAEKTLRAFRPSAKTLSQKLGCRVQYTLITGEVADKQGQPLMKQIKKELAGGADSFWLVFPMVLSGLFIVLAIGTWVQHRLCGHSHVWSWGHRTESLRVYEFLCYLVSILAVLAAAGFYRELDDVFWNFLAFAGAFGLIACTWFSDYNFRRKYECKLKKCLPHQAAARALASSLMLFAAAMVLGGSVLISVLAVFEAVLFVAFYRICRRSWVDRFYCAKGEKENVLGAFMEGAFWVALVLALVQLIILRPLWHAHWWGLGTAITWAAFVPILFCAVWLARRGDVRHKKHKGDVYWRAQVAAWVLIILGWLIGYRFGPTVAMDLSYVFLVLYVITKFFDYDVRSWGAHMAQGYLGISITLLVAALIAYHRPHYVVPAASMAWFEYM